MATQDQLALGMSIVFDQKSLDQFNYITNAVKKMQKQFDGLGDPLKKAIGSLQQVSQKVNDVRDAGMKLIKAQETLNKNGKTIVETYKNLDGTISKITTQYNHQNQIANQSVKINQTLGKTVNGIATSIGNAVSKMALWSASGLLLFGTFRGIVSSMKTMADLETQAVNIAKVLPNPDDLSLKDLVSPFEQSAISLAKEYGQSVLDVEGAMQSWARQYKNVNDISVMTRASLLAATATDISFGESVTTISSIMAEFQMETKNAIHVVDVLNEMSNNYRTTAGDVAVALTKTSAGAKAVGLSFEELTGIVTTGIQALGVSGDEIGTMLTRVFARIKGNKSAKEAFSNLGIDPSGTMSEMLDQLMVKWDSLSQAEKQNFAITVAGTHHWNRFLGIMENYDTVLQATAKSYFSFGSAQREVDNVMATLNKKIEQLSATWEEYIHRNSGALGVQKGVVDSLRYIIQGLSKISPSVTVAIIGITALTAVFLTLRNAFLASNMALGLFTKSLLMNPWTAAIAGVTILASLLLWAGKNASSAADQVAELETKVAGLTQEIEGNINKVRGITDMSQKYQRLSEAIEGAKKRGENYTGLQNKLNAVVGELARAYGKTNSEMEIWISKDGGMAKFAQNRINELVAELNLKRQIAYEDEKKIAATKGMTKLTSFLTGGEDVKKAFDIYYKSLNLQDTSKYQKQDKALYDKVIGALDKTSGMQFGEELAARFRAITEFEKNGKPQNLTVKDILNQTGGIDTGDITDTGKVSATITTFSEEIINMIQTAGSKLDKQINDVITNPASKLEIKQMGVVYQDEGQNKFKNINISSESWSKLSSAAGRLQTIMDDMSKVGNQLNDVQKIYDNAANKASSTGKTFKNTEEEISVRQKMGNQLDSLKEKTQSYVDDLNKLVTEFGGSSEVTKELARAQELLRQIEEKRKENDKELKEAEQKLIMQQKVTNLATSAVDTLVNSLTNLGGAAQVMGAVINSVAKNITQNANGKLEFNLAGAGLDLLSWGINQLLSGLFKSAEKYQAYERDEYSITPAFEAANKRSAQMQQIKDYQTKIANAQAALNGPIPKEYQNPGYGTWVQALRNNIDYWNSEIQKINDEILQNLDDWVEAIGVSVDDIANTISEAFQADSYSDFLTNWNESLYNMTKEALIKGFLAQSTYQQLYQGLSDLIGLSVLDGMLSEEEISAIKQKGNEIAKNMKPFYDALNVLDSAMGGSGGGSSSSESNYTAGTSQAISISNYVNIYGTYFGEDPDGLREFCLLVARTIAEEQSRA